jgi:hypothetical protein
MQIRSLSFYKLQSDPMLRSASIVRAFMLIGLVAFSESVRSQYVHKIKADTVKLYNDACTTEFILQNATRNTKGFLYNKGNGLTEFRKALIKLSDSTYLIGSDTLYLSYKPSGIWVDLTGTQTISGLKTFTGDVKLSGSRTLRFERPAITNRGGVEYATNNTNLWFAGIQSNADSWDLYNYNTGSNALSINNSTNTVSLTGSLIGTNITANNIAATSFTGSFNGNLNGNAATATLAANATKWNQQQYNPVPVTAGSTYVLVFSPSDNQYHDITNANFISTLGLATNNAVSSSYIPYNGATTAVNLGSQNFTTAGGISGGNVNAQGIVLSNHGVNPLSASAYSSGNFEARIGESQWNAGARPGYGFHAGNVAGSYLYMDGSNTFKSIDAGGSTVTLLTSGNFNSYAPTLTGGGANGTWNINITGNAATTSQTNFSALTVGGTQVVTNNGGTWNIGVSNASNWNGQSYSGSAATAKQYVLVYDNLTSQWRPEQAGKFVYGTNMQNATFYSINANDRYRAEFVTSFQGGAGGWYSNGDAGMVNIPIWHGNDGSSSGRYNLQIGAHIGAASPYYRITGPDGTGTWRNFLTDQNYTNYTLPLSGGTLSGDIILNYQRVVGFKRADGITVGAIGYNSLAGNDFIIGGVPGYGETAGQDVKLRGFGGNLLLGTAGLDMYTLSAGITSNTVAHSFKANNSNSGYGIIADFSSYGGDEKLRIDMGNGDGYSYIGTATSHNLGFKMNGTKRMWITSGEIQTNLPMIMQSQQGKGITMYYDGSTNYQYRMRPYWNSASDTRIDFEINRASGTNPQPVLSMYSTSTGAAIRNWINTDGASNYMGGYEIYYSTNHGSRWRYNAGNAETLITNDYAGTAPGLVYGNIALLAKNFGGTGYRENLVVRGHDGATELRGYSVHDGSTGRYGEYGQLVFPTTGTYTASSREWLLTNAYQANKFAVLFSDNYNTRATITNGGMAGANTNAAMYFDYSGSAQFNYNVGVVGNLTVTNGLLRFENEAKGIYVYDTRNTNPIPSSYEPIVRWDFKNNATNGLFDGGSYNGVMTWRKYGSSTDFTGGPAMQIAYSDNNNLWHRISTGNTTWGAWVKLLDASNYSAYSPTLSGGGAVGTWGINISGSAASAANSNQWGGYGFDATAYASGFDYLYARTTGSAQGRLVTAAGVQSWLGLGANAYSSTSFLPTTGGTINGMLTANAVTITNQYASNGGTQTGFITSAYDTDSYFKLRNNTSNSLALEFTRSDGANVLQIDGHSLAATFGGTITASAVFESSDTTLKNISHWNYSDSSIPSIRYTWKDRRDPLMHIGYPAQSVQKILPDAVAKDMSGKLTVNYDEVHTYKISEIEKREKERAQEIAELKNKIKQLEQLINSVKNTKK